MKIALPVIAIFGMGLIALVLSGEIASKPDENLIVSGSDRDLPYRISKLEAKVTTLESRIKELESKPRVITIPGSQVPPGNQMPPGATPFDFNGMRFWMVPVNKK
jgi:hypothetical protein